MSRLIDADKLKDELKTLLIMSNWGEAFMPILIDKQPTAYDIDEIVNKLEELVEKNIGYMRGTPSASAYIQAIKDAIDVVKAV